MKNFMDADTIFVAVAGIFAWHRFIKIQVGPKSDSDLQFLFFQDFQHPPHIDVFSQFFQFFFGRFVRRFALAKASDKTLGQ